MILGNANVSSMLIPVLTMHAIHDNWEKASAVTMMVQREHQSYCSYMNNSLRRHPYSTLKSMHSLHTATDLDMDTCHWQYKIPCKLPIICLQACCNQQFIRPAPSCTLLPCITTNILDIGYW